MDAERFDRLTRALTAVRPRRIVLAGLAGGLLSALGFAADQNGAE